MPTGFFVFLLVIHTYVLIYFYHQKHQRKVSIAHCLHKYLQFTMRVNPGTCFYELWVSSHMYECLTDVVVEDWMG